MNSHECFLAQPPLASYRSTRVQAARPVSAATTTRQQHALAKRSHILAAVVTATTLPHRKIAKISAAPAVSELTANSEM